jgi:uncharacterized membrane protein
MINAKEFVDTSKTYKNMLKVSEGEIESIQAKTRTLENEIIEEKDSIKKSKDINNILKILFVAIFLAIVAYATMGSWAHILVFIILLSGLGIALYTRGEIPPIDFSYIKQWTSTTLGL